jgi:hypothetical protein
MITMGWHVCVECYDGTMSWKRLADLKELNPVEFSEYATTQNLQDEPVFV